MSQSIPKILLTSSALGILWDIIMTNIYTARVYKNEGRKSFSISFRHPLKTERGKAGRKVCKGLGTEIESEAEQMRDGLNALLAAKELHSQAGKQEAIKRGYDKRIIEIFYDGLDPAVKDQRTERDRLLELPGNGSTRTLLLGITGAGKTTLLRRLIGTNATTDRFPSTSVNRTTTCPIEIITGGRDFKGVVTFLSQHQVQQEVIESLSAAVLEAVEDGDEERIMKEFLEKSDMRFRLKYILGGWGDSSVDDEFSFSDEETLEDDSETEVVSASEAERLQKFLQTICSRVKKIAQHARKHVEGILEKKLSELEGDDRDYALDEIQDEAEQSDAFLELISDVMAEIQDRFTHIKNGEFEKTSTGWPVAWSLVEPGSRRKDFLAAIRWFSGNAKVQWGRLLTPIVSGIRVRGPFRPEWASTEYDHVFIDTEGLAHSKASADVPNELTSLFKNVDNILLVESAKNALHSPAAAKVFEAVSSTGYTPKFAVAFTHMDHASGENLANAKDKKEQVFGGIRNVLDNQVAKNVSRDAARQLENHLLSNTFYFAYLDPKKYPSKDESKTIKFEKAIGKSLDEMTITLAARTQPELKLPAYPKYSMHSLGIAVREGSEAFVESWEARLGFKRIESFPTAPWQSIKALSRRYAEGWLWDGFWLRPIDNLTTTMRNVLSKFLDSPMDWGGRPGATEEQKVAAINSIKNEVNEALTKLAAKRLRERPLVEWQYAYGRSGTGSTFERRNVVRNIFHVQIPVPNSVSDKIAQEWIEIFQKLIDEALERLQEQVDAKINIKEDK
ncbi:MAG TPA: hypothetical protein VMH87_11680 [Pseudomonadales bacterium]|nr:hypothetical protein [Pseudomonadales bacterium]